MEFSSGLLSSAVEQIQRLPGIGKKSALRIALFLLKKDQTYTEYLSQAITAFRKEINYCSVCYNLCDEKICTICNDQKRDKEIICVVQHMTDVLSIENTPDYKGVYHVLGGIISPIQGIGPVNIRISELLDRIQDHIPKEIIFALPATIEGETTLNYISEQVRKVSLSVHISTVARGLPVGGELEYADQVTLSRSISERRQVTNTIK